MRTYETLLLNRCAGVTTLTLNRPDALNAVNGTMHRELSQVFRDLAHDPETEIVVLTGAGRAFCAGGDLEWLGEMIATPDLFLSVVDEAKQIVFSMLELSKPVICRLHGDAVGLGATLALLCDVIVAAETARFGDPHVRVGLVAGDGAAVILPQVVGYMRAKELLLTGNLLSAAEAQALGIINHVVPASQVDARVAEIAGRLHGGATQAIRYTKTALNSGLRKLAEEQMDMLMAYEALSARSADHAEAVSALREKRKPVFKGN